MTMWGTPIVYVPTFDPPDHKGFATLEEANAAVKEHDAKVAKGTLWQCTSSVLGAGCGKLSRVEDTDAVQEMNYVQPYSCSGGDYYVRGEILVVCTHCGLRNRTYGGNPLDKLEFHFKSLTKEYQD